MGSFEKLKVINNELESFCNSINPFLRSDLSENLPKIKSDEVTKILRAILLSGDPQKYQEVANYYFKRVPLNLNTISFDIVDGCQLRCIGCPNSTLKPKVFPVSLDSIKKRVSNIDINSAKRVRLYRFGEPLFHDDLKEVLKIFKIYSGINIRRIDISTNAQYHNFDSLMPALDSNLLDVLSISADGDGTASSYEYHRPPGKWKRVIDFISIVSDYIQKNSLRTELHLGVIVPTKISSSKTKLISDPDVIKRWKNIMSNYNITSFDFRPMLLMPGSKLSEEKKFDSSFQMYKAKKGLCSSIVNPNLYIDGKGFIQPCCQAIDIQRIGDLNKHKYTEILLDSFFKFYSKMINNRDMIPSCRACPETSPVSIQAINK